jgi:hypothetical protein
MRTSLTSVTKSAASVVRVVACLVSVALLLTFPLGKAHTFNDHFRTPEIRRSIVRNTQVAETDNATSESVQRINIRPIPLPQLLDPNKESANTTNVEFVPQAAPTRLFLRLKLGTSPGGGEDPLI